MAVKNNELMKIHIVRMTMELIPLQDWFGKCKSGVGVASRVFPLS